MTALSYDEAAAHLVAHDPRFAIHDETIRGVRFRVFSNAPADLRALLQQAREAQGNGAQDYLVFQDERWTYDEFCTEIKALAKALETRLGVTKGRRVGIAMRNCPEMLFLMMAIASVGGIATFLNAWWTPEELNYALDDSGADIIFADADRAARLGGLNRAFRWPYRVTGVSPVALHSSRFQGTFPGDEEACAPDLHPGRCGLRQQQACRRQGCRGRLGQARGQQGRRRQGVRERRREEGRRCRRPR